MGSGSTHALHRMTPHAPGGFGGLQTGRSVADHDRSPMATEPREAYGGRGIPPLSKNAHSLKAGEYPALHTLRAVRRPEALGRRPLVIEAARAWARERPKNSFALAAFPRLGDVSIAYDTRSGSDGD